ncbi:dihydroneopterin aldolase [Candidatus Haliotispira prima]|uniref:Bifunctional folate synthesis protein n=1 Tax=Candidatus Haliotispira prima TaxID=3034016 RepID=A0ABY8MJT6_9SPIO|nr:dihydroneopterin aldolase [Candidatus Haliotispira prima]
MADKIFFQKLRFYAYHGIFLHERLRGQYFELDLEVSCDLSPAGSSGRLEDSVDYSRLYQLVKAVVTGRCFSLLETLGSCICREILEQFGTVREVTLRLYKPEAPLEGGLIADELLDEEKTGALAQWNHGLFGPGGSVGIELRRQRQPAGGPNVTDFEGRSESRETRLASVSPVAVTAVAAIPAISSTVAKTTMTTTTTVAAITYLSLGSNLGRRNEQLGQAIRLLDEHPAITVAECSSVYETKPWGLDLQRPYEPDKPSAQASFRNLCLRLELNEALLTESSSGEGRGADRLSCALRLLEYCLECEKRLGRDRNAQNKENGQNGQNIAWEPRCIDIDLIDYECATGRIDMNINHINHGALNQAADSGFSLELPHPRFLRRLFVLVPLAEIAGPELDSAYALQKNIQCLEAMPENRDWGYRVCDPLFGKLSERRREDNSKINDGRTESQKTTR